MRWKLTGLADARCLNAAAYMSIRTRLETISYSTERRSHLVILTEVDIRSRSYSAVQYGAMFS